MPRLGQLLVRADLVTENNLARALGIQQFAGGRIGTLLLERGSVNEDDLGSALELQHGCPYVPWHALSDISPDVIASLPAKFAIKHAAIPYELGENYLKLALRDPADLRILDELFFVTGRKILPSVAPEVRIYQALEKYYGDRRTPRFAILAEKLSRPARAARTGSTSLPPPPEFFSEPAQKPAPIPAPQEIWGDTGEPELAEPPIIQSWKIPDQRIGGWAGTASSPSGPGELEELHSITWEEMAPPPISVPTSPAPVPSTPAPPLTQPSPSLASDLLTRDTEALPPAGAPLPPEAAPPAAATPPEAAVSAREPAAISEEARKPVLPETPPPAPRRDLPTTSDFPEVLAATDRDSIATAALVALARRFGRCAIFAARPNVVSGWGAAGQGVDASQFRAVEIPWTEPSIFLNVRLSRSFYLGALPPLPRHEALTRVMGGWPQECVVQPVLIRDKPVAFLYAEFSREKGATPIDLAYLRELSAAMSLAFAAAIRLKKKEI